MILELYPKFPYFMSDELYRTIMVTITGILSSLIVFLLIRYFKYRKQKDFDKEVLNEKIRIELGAIAMGIKGSKTFKLMEISEMLTMLIWKEKQKTHLY